jgi:choline dehydrogenase
VSKVDHWDYVIVGGGSAGCVLANRLSADPATRVLLLEAGRSSDTLISKIPAGVPLALGRKDMNWQYLAEPDPSRNEMVDMWPAGRMLGGGSALNGMMYVRGHRNDYDSWAAAGNIGWGMDDLLPYFRRMEDNERGGNAWRGSGGPQAVSEGRIRHPLDEVFVTAAQEIGIPFNDDLNGEFAEGVGYVQATQRNGQRASTARSYIEPVRARANLEVRLHCPVTRVLIEAGRASGVEYRRDGIPTTASAAHGVIVSAGALATPGVLLRSGLGPAARLAELGIEATHDLPGVGQNLQEHAAVRMSFHSTVPTLNSDMGPLRNVAHVLNYVFHKRGPLAMVIGHAQAFVRSQPDLPAPNLQIIFAPLALEFTDKGPRPYPKPAGGFAIGLAHAHSRGRIDIPSRDPDARPLIHYPLVGHPTDMQHLVEGCRIARRLMGTQALAPYVIDERLPGLSVQSDEQWESFIRQTAFLMYHPCGTARMGTDKMAVVDPQLRVRGVQGLWVADASVIPTIPAGNINATCIVIGEKASDLVRAARRNA